MPWPTPAGSRRSRRAMEARYEVGMCASQVRLFGRRPPRLGRHADLPRRQQQAARPSGRRPQIFRRLQEVLSAQRFRRPLPARHAGRNRPVRRTTSSCTAKTRTWACARAGPAGNASTCRMRWWSIAIPIRPGEASAAQGVLCRAQPALRGREEFSGVHAAGALPLLRHRALLLASWYLLQGRGAAASFRSEGNGVAERCAGMYLRAHVALLRNFAALLAASAAPSEAALDTPGSSSGCCAQHSITRRARCRACDARSRTGLAADHRARLQRGGRDRRRGPVRFISMPGAPVLVIDDCSTDATIDRASEAGARVLPLPHHLGLGRLRAGRLQAGLRAGLRVRDPRGWRRPARSRATSRASTTRCALRRQMVIGSRFVERDGRAYAARARPRHPFFPLVLRPILGKPVHDPTSGIRGREPHGAAGFQPEFSAGISGDRGAGRAAAASGSVSRKSPCQMRPRQAGRQFDHARQNLSYYIVHVLLGVFVNILKYDARAAVRRGSN